MADNDKYKHLKAMGWITQFGLNMISPIILCLVIAVWLKNKFQIGNWIIFVAIILGIASSCLNMFTYIKTVNKEMGGKNDDKERKD